MKLVNSLSIAQQFNRCATTYDQAAVFDREVADRLLSRLQWMKLDPQRILNLGARTGYMAAQLCKIFPKSQLVNVDLSEALLNQTPRGWFKKHKSLVCADCLALPFIDRCFDLVISNVTLPWVNDELAFFTESYRVLKPSGLLLFTSLGPDTLKELRSSLGDQHVHEFTDMHNLGDALLQANFLDPVMDMEYLSLKYPSIKHFLRELKSVGATNCRADRQVGLMGRQKWQEFIASFPEGAPVSVTTELIFGHAWLPDQPDLARLNHQGEAYVSLASLTKSK